MPDKLSYFEEALKHGGLRLAFPTAREAVAFRHSLYRARRKYNLRPSSVGRFDRISLEVHQKGQSIGVGKAYDKEGEAVLLILTGEEAGPTVTDLRGNAVVLLDNALGAEAEADPEFLAAALAARTSLGIE